MSEVPFVVKIRDGAQMIADAANEYLESKAPKDEEVIDFEKLLWADKKGEKGPYQQTSKQNNGNNDLWQTLQKKLKEHSGFWQTKTCTYWFHQNDNDVVDRRAKK
jgi:hypothetical protein